MRPCYKSPAYFQVGWSSLQTGSRKQRNRHRVVGVQTGSLETSNLKSSRKCAQKIFKPHQTAEVGLGCRPSSLLPCCLSTGQNSQNAHALKSLEKELRQFGFSDFEPPTLGKIPGKG